MYWILKLLQIVGYFCEHSRLYAVPNFVACRVHVTRHMRIVKFMINLAIPRDLNWERHYPLFGKIVFVWFISGHSTPVQSELELQCLHMYNTWHMSHKSFKGLIPFLCCSWQTGPSIWLGTNIKIKYKTAATSFRAAQKSSRGQLIRPKKISLFPVKSQKNLWSVGRLFFIIFLV